MKAIAKTLRISPYKLNLIAGLVRNKAAVEALNILKFTPKKGANMLEKVVKSAIANAENNFKQDPSSLFIKEIIVNKGMMMKRGVPISRGRVYPILKRNSHVTVIIGVSEVVASSAPKKGKTAKAANLEKATGNVKAAKSKMATKKKTAKAEKIQNS